mgnify:FL=1|jgi:hypothetical protein
MKQFLIEWCINLSIVILVVIYVGNFFLGCYLLDVLDDNILKGAIYLSLWVIFYAVTTVTCYMVFFRKK